MRLKQAAFTLLELLCVVGCLLLLVGIAGGAVWHIQAAMQLRSSATEFIQTVKTARQFAIDHRCRTRIAFRPGLYGGAATEKPDDDHSYALFAFVVPSVTPGDRGRWVEVTAGNRSSQTNDPAELVRLELSPRPEGMVGRWIPCSLDPKIRRVPETVKIDSELFDHFVNDEEETFFSENYYSPESAWALRGADPYEPENSISIYPSDYWRTPIHQPPVLMNGTMPEWALCYDPITGDVVKAATFWPGTVQFFAGTDATKSAALPGIEFQPDGSLACLWTREIEVRFGSAQRSGTGYLVSIDVVTGLPRLVDEEVQ